MSASGDNKKSLVGGLPALQVGGGTSEKKEDFSKTADEVIPSATQKAAAGNLDEAMQTLLSLEKKSRLVCPSIFLLNAWGFVPLVCIIPYITTMHDNYHRRETLQRPYAWRKPLCPSTTCMDH